MLPNDYLIFNMHVHFYHVQTIAAHGVVLAACCPCMPLNAVTQAMGQGRFIPFPCATS